MAAPLRAIRSSAFLRHVAAFLGASIIWVAERTVRWTVEGAEVRGRIQTGKGQWALAVPHGRVLMVPAERRPGLNAVAMISANRDGEIITETVGWFGVRTVRGSSIDPRKADRDRGGRRALNDARSIFDTEPDVLVAITPDGPRGPLLRPKGGIAVLSAAAGVPVVPWVFSTKPALVMGSWDKFMVPVPFAKGAKVVGDPIYPPESMEPEAIEAHRQAIEDALIEATQRADRIVGRVPIEPGESRG